VIRRVRCFIVECDDCSTAFGDDGDEGYTVHFDSHDEVLCHLDAGSWTVTENGHLRCRACTARANCDTAGHMWDFWAPCHCNATVPTHAENGCPLMRMCLHCGHLESANLAELPTIDEPHIPGR
jgi:hypothetical protein